jgi:hypothetical protein
VSDSRLVAVPDTDGELLHGLDLLEELLLALIAYGPEGEPGVYGLGADALEALRMILWVVHAAEDGRALVLIASDGRFELVPVRFVHLRDGTSVP